MRRERLSFRSVCLFSVLTVGGLSACSDGARLTQMQPSLSSPSMGASGRTNSASGSLYISSYGIGAHGAVLVYGGRQLTYIRAITDGIDLPAGMAVNSRKQLLVVNNGADTVTVYNPGGSSPLHTVTRGLKDPGELAISSTNDVYVVNYWFVNIYKNGFQKRFKRIDHRAGSIAIDASDNVYLSAAGVVDVYASGAIEPTRTITQGLDFPVAMSVDKSGNLYVANYGSSKGYCGKVTIYDAATGVLKNTVTDGICSPYAFAFDAAGDLYVGNMGRPKSGKASVTIYAAGTNALKQTITKGVVAPTALAVDPSGNLYVANYADRGTVSIYPPGTTSPSKTLTKNISYPGALDWVQ